MVVRSRLRCERTDIGSYRVTRGLSYNVQFDTKYAVLVPICANFKNITVSECCLIKSLPYILLEKYTYMLSFEVASPGNRHCASCIGTLSFTIATGNMHRNFGAALTYGFERQTYR